MSAVIMRAPKFKIRGVGSRLVYSLASRLMERREIEGDHDVCTNLLGAAIAVAISVLSGVVVRAIDDELLSCTLWLDNYIVYENRGLRDL
jgi:hypothetical protein